MSPRKYRIGTRKSALALTQSRQVMAFLEEQGVRCELVEIESSGDQDRKTPLYQIEPESPGLFTKQLEVALEAHEIDLAVHSLKDLPTQQPEGLGVAAVGHRVDSDDCLLVHGARYDQTGLYGLPPGATVGTSSLRREAQLLAVRPDLKIVPIRGNVPTRLRKAETGEVDAVVLAEAGLFRLGLEPKGAVPVRLPRDRFVSAPGQGALAVETRREIPNELAIALAKFHDSASEIETRVERQVLAGLHGGCTLPLGARCEARPAGLKLAAFLGLSRDRKDAPREWLGFERFELEKKDPRELVETTVAHFKQWMSETHAKSGQRGKHG